jgi:hypothetical protein
MNPFVEGIWKSTNDSLHNWRMKSVSQEQCRLRNKRTLSTCVVVALSQRSTSHLTYLRTSVQLTAVLESLVMWYGHNYATQSLTSQNQVLKSKGHHHFLCNRATSSTVQHVGPHYHSSKYCRMGCHLSPHSDAAMGQSVGSTGCWTPSY